MRVQCADLETYFLISDAEWGRLIEEGYDDDDLDCDGNLTVDDEPEYFDVKRILNRH